MAAADVVIIGGGCMGTSTAFHLARRRHGRVLLLERDRVGSGPTARTVGIIRLHYSFEPLIQLALRSLDTFRHFEALTGRSADFTRTGFVLLVPEAEWEGLVANVALQRRLGVRVEVLTVEEVMRLDPRLNPEGIAGGVYEPDSGFADGYATATAFAAAARAHGAQIEEGVRAEAVEVRNGRVVRVRTAQGSVDTGTVLVAAGAWSVGLLQTVGIELPIVAAREQVVHLAPPAAFGPLRFVLEDLALGFYARPETGGTALVGVLEEEPEEVVDPDGFNAGVDLSFVERVARLWGTRFPQAQESRFRGGYASIYDVTPDWQPILGPVEGIEGLYLAAGFSGHGFKLSPALGEELSRWLAGEEPTVDLRIFSLSRFREGRLLRGRHRRGLLG